MAEYKKYYNPWSADGTSWYGKDSNRWLDYNPEGDILHIPATFMERPSWATMLAAYPGPSIKTFDLYQMIGGFLGNFEDEAALQASSYINSCAFRMSYGLNQAGYTLPKRQNTHQLVLKGDDGKYYWGRVMELYNLMRNSLLGEPDVSHTLKKAKYGEAKEGLTSTEMSEYTSRKGIIMFLVSGWGDASGHFTLWDGSNLVYPGNPLHDDPSSEYYYFKMKYNVNRGGKQKVIQTDKIMLWEFD